MPTPDIEDSSDYLRESQAKKPVIAAAAKQEGDLGEAFYSQGAGEGYMPTPNQPDVGLPTPAPAEPRMSYAESVYGQRPSGINAPVTISPEGPPRSAAGAPPIVAQSATQRRVIDAGNAVPVTPRELPSAGGYPATDPNLIQDSLSSRQRAQERTIAGASEEANLREGTRGMRADAARAQAGFDQQRAESEARVARFRAANGADVILGSSRRTKDRAARILGAQADAADQRLLAVSGRATAPDAPGRDPLADALAVADGSNKGLATTLAGQAGVVASAVEKQKLEHAQRVNQLGAAVAGAKTPQERSDATKSLLALLGKDPKKSFQAIPITLPESTDPTTGAALRGGQAVAIIGDDGSRDIVRLDGGGGQGKPAGSPAKEGEVRKDPVSGKTAKFVNGKWVPI